MTDIDQLLTPAEVAELLKLQPSTLVEWRRLRKGPRHIRVGHRTVRYRRSDIDAWLESAA